MPTISPDHSSTAQRSRARNLRRARPGHLLVLGALLLLAACRPTIADPGSGAPSGTSEPATPPPRSSATATPTPRLRIQLTDDGLPLGVVGPLLLYRSPTDDTLANSPGSPGPEVVVWDVGAELEIGRFWIGEPVRLPQASLIAGHHLVVNYGDALWRFTLDGTREPIFEAPVDSVITSITVDRSGEFAVVALQTRLGDPVRLQWIEVATGLVVREAAPIVDEATFGRPHPRIVGAPEEPALLQGATSPDRPGGYAILEPDGALRALATIGFATPSSDGAYVAHGPATQSCDLIHGSRIELLSVADGSALASFEDPTLALTPWEWSPDGVEFAFQARPIGGGSAPCDWTIDPPRWFVLSLDGSIREEQSGIAVRTAWSGERAVTFSCLSAAEEPGAHSRTDGLLRASECALDPADILLDGEPIGRGTGVTILGYIEAK